jgi:hypothetical protein
VLVRSRPVDFNCALHGGSRSAAIVSGHARPKVFPRKRCQPSLRLCAPRSTIYKHPRPAGRGRFPAGARVGNRRGGGRWLTTALARRNSKWRPLWRSAVREQVSIAVTVVSQGGGQSALTTFTGSAGSTAFHLHCDHRLSRLGPRLSGPISRRRLLQPTAAALPSAREAVRYAASADHLSLFFGILAPDLRA